MTDTVPGIPPPAVPPSVALDLYKAAIGPVNASTYLTRFGSFDEQGKTSATWHWPAFFSALNWLLFRGMWGAALSYTALMLIAVIGLLVLGRLAYDLSWETTVILLAAFVGVASVLAGLYAHGAYYRFCKKHIVQTVELSTSMQDARTRLRSDAPTRKRQGVLAGFNIALLAALSWGWTQLPEPGTSHVSQSLSVQTPTLPVTTASVSSPPSSAPSSITPSPATSVAAAVADAAIVAAPAASDSAPTGPSSPVSSPIASNDASSGSSTRASSNASAQPEKSAVSAPKRSKPEAPVGSTRYFVQVGVFAVEDNALSLQEKLEAQGFRVHTLGMKTPKGVLIQVRVGPFDSSAEADETATQLKAMDLPTWVFRISP